MRAPIRYKILRSWSKLLDVRLIVFPFVEPTEFVAGGWDFGLELEGATMQEDSSAYVKELHLQQGGIELGGNITNSVDELPHDVTAANGIHSSISTSDDTKEYTSKKKRKKQKKDSENLEDERLRTSYWALFKYADALDILLMTVGTLGAIANGLTLPAMLIIQSHLINTFGSLQTNPASISANISKVLQQSFSLSLSFFALCIDIRYDSLLVGKLHAT